MNWGNAIVLVFVAFAAIMVTMVTICIKQDDLHLVTQNYYEEEIKYQEHIDKVINSRDLGVNVLQYDAANKELALDLPEGASGSLHLFRPSDARLDQKLKIEGGDKESRMVELKVLKPGYWHLKLTWERDGLSYYEEKKVDL
ncbi:FixH family protein [Pleomorphovibrio marinus]|uniref:FixH family protein n=1 Tax=Pleomorphovibrio marinus TaxID=2164132 RepID=UPI000E0A452D|nr:FixH family protein [Pleomorphovibrio marinus]